jgi:hypothetical protein
MVGHHWGMSNFHDQIFNSLNQKETGELIKIWKANDRITWSELAFDVLREILINRIGKLPQRSEREHKRAKTIHPLRKTPHYRDPISAASASGHSYWKYMLKKILTICFYIICCSLSVLIFVLISTFALDTIFRVMSGMSPHERYSPGDFFLGLVMMAACIPEIGIGIGFGIWLVRKILYRGNR